jgi:hypothetical protein
LPKVKAKGDQQYDSILVFVDRFSKTVHMAACSKTGTSLDTAMLLYQNIYRLHGNPLEIVSDRDPRFTGKFFKS